MRTHFKVSKQPPNEALDSRLFAIRIPGSMDLHSHIRKVLRKLRLMMIVNLEATMELFVELRVIGGRAVKS